MAERGRAFSQAPDSLLCATPRRACDLSSGADSNNLSKVALQVCNIQSVHAENGSKQFHRNRFTDFGLTMLLESQILSKVFASVPVSTKRCTTLPMRCAKNKVHGEHRALACTFF